MHDEISIMGQVPIPKYRDILMYNRFQADGGSPRELTHVINALGSGRGVILC